MGDDPKVTVDDEGRVIVGDPAVTPWRCVPLNVWSAHDVPPDLAVGVLLRALRGPDVRLLRAALLTACDCDDPDMEPPTAWASCDQGRQIPHHVDCPLYAIDLPDPERTPAAHEDALQRREDLLIELDEHDADEGRAP